MLQRLERPDRTAVLLTNLRVGEGRLEDLAAPAGRHRCQRDRALLHGPRECPFDAGRSRRDEDAVRVDADVVEADVGDGQGRVERGTRCRDDRRAGNHERAEPGIATSDHHHLVGGCAVEDGALGAGDDPLVAAPPSSGPDGVRRPSATLGHGQRSRQSRRGDLLEEPRRLLEGARCAAELAHGRHELRRRGEERTRHNRATELLRYQRELDESETEPSVLLVDRERRPTQLDHAVPELGGPLVALEDGAHDGNGTDAREHRADVVAQRRLVI